MLEADRLLRLLFFEVRFLAQLPQRYVLNTRKD